MCVVTLYDATTGALVVGFNGLSESYTDYGTGRYQIDGIAAGTYFVRAVPGPIADPAVGGWYRAGVPGHYASTMGDAIPIKVGP